MHEVPVCLDCGTPMLAGARGVLYCPKCEVADDLVVTLDDELGGH